MAASVLPSIRVWQTACFSACVCASSCLCAARLQSIPFLPPAKKMNPKPKANYASLHICVCVHACVYFLDGPSQGQIALLKEGIETLAVAWSMNINGSFTVTEIVSDQKSLIFNVNVWFEVTWVTDCERHTLYKVQRSMMQYSDHR